MICTSFTTMPFHFCMALARLATLGLTMLALDEALARSMSLEILLSRSNIDMMRGTAGGFELIGTS